MMKTFRIITLGCKVNQYESAFLDEALQKEGCRQAGAGEQADITIVNTCIVTQRAAHQSRQAIRKAVRETRSGTVAAVGCYAQAAPEELTRIRGLGLVADNISKARIPEELLRQGDGKGQQTLRGSFHQGMPFEYLPVKGLPERTRAYLKIQDGCESFCSYCIVPTARGPLRSLAAQEVIRALASFAAAGTQEVVLTGIHIGQYGVDLRPPVGLPALLRLIGKEGLPLRVRLSSIEPKEVVPDLVELVAYEPWLCRHFHIPLQSGDDGILSRMNRAYRAKDYIRLIEDIHRRFPLAALGADVMVGFPGEDEGAFRRTYTLIGDLPISYLHVFPYSPRRGTPAASFPGQVDPKAASERAARLRALGQEKRKAFYQSCLGKEFTVLAEGWHSEEKKSVKGLSDNYLPIHFPSRVELNNRMVPVRVERLEGRGVLGRVVDP
ncbi:MAG: tRNA (N(6)-L-threonylcarbamoyladenosine(37)-C(2))-methylthiotransferase MtaB [Thermodesulfobacteriota bacterium]